MAFVCEWVDFANWATCGCCSSVGAVGLVAEERGGDLQIQAVAFRRLRRLRVRNETCCNDQKSVYRGLLNRCRTAGVECGVCDYCTSLFAVNQF